MANLNGNSLVFRGHWMDNGHVWWLRKRQQSDRSFDSGDQWWQWRWNQTKQQRGRCRPPSTCGHNKHFARRSIVEWRSIFRYSRVYLLNFFYLTSDDNCRPPFIWPFSHGNCHQNGNYDGFRFLLERTLKSMSCLTMHVTRTILNIRCSESSNAVHALVKFLIARINRENARWTVRCLWNWYNYRSLDYFIWYWGYLSPSTCNNIIEFDIFTKILSYLYCFHKNQQFKTWKA